MLAGEHRIDQPVGTDGPVQLVQIDAGLDHGHVVVDVDLENPVHALEGHQDAVGTRHRRPRKPRTTAPGDDRGPVRVGHAEDSSHLVGATRSDEDQGQDGRGRRERFVVGVVVVDGRAEQDVVSADDLDQPLGEVTHALLRRLRREPPYGHTVGSRTTDCGPPDVTVPTGVPGGDDVVRTVWKTPGRTPLGGRTGQHALADPAPVHSVGLRGPGIETGLAEVGLGTIPGGGVVQAGQVPGHLVGQDLDGVRIGQLVPDEAQAAQTGSRARPSQQELSPLTETSPWTVVSS